MPLSRRQFLKNSFAVSFAPTFLSACSNSATPYRSQIFVFGTQVDILIYHPDKATIQSAIGKINEDFQQFHHEWHAWEKGGILSKINDAIKDNRPVTIAKSVQNFIEYSQQLSKQSNYLFDPAIGQLVALWGFHSEHWQGPPPDNQKIQNWLNARPSIADIYFEDSQLFSKNRLVQLDFGGNAKGLALDMAISSLQESGIHSALVSIGGDMKALGLKPVNQAWQIGIQNPSNPSDAVATVELFSNESLVTSGTYQRFFEWQGVTYSHLLNPNTGWPVSATDSFVSVTVIHPDATRADSAASALLIAGPDDWQTVAQQMQIQHALAIDAQGKHYHFGKIAERILNPNT